MSEALTPGEFARALQDKRNAERRRRWWFRGGLAAALVLVSLGVWLAFFSTVFAAQQVSVTGVSLLTTDQVVTAAEVSMGEPLLTQDLGAVTQRVNDLPAVRSAEVSRQLPDTVVIEVTERTAAFLRERDGQYDWIDEEGVAFHRTASPGPQDVPATVAVVEDQQRLLADVATVANHIPADVRPAVVSISAEAVDRISLALEGGRTVVWGSADESELKADVVSALLSVEATVYDVSAPGHPTTK